MNTMRLLTVFVVGSGSLMAIAVLLALACRRFAAAPPDVPPRPMAPGADAGGADSATVDLAGMASTGA